MTDLVARYGGDVRRLDTPAGTAFSLKEIEDGLAANPGVKVLFLVHGESSTGVLQPLDGVGELRPR